MPLVQLRALMTVGCALHNKETIHADILVTRPQVIYLLKGNCYDALLNEQHDMLTLRLANIDIHAR